MRPERLVVFVVLMSGLAGCGGSSAPPAGQTQAAAACTSSGANAATLAAAAANLNPRYATLAADEASLEADEAPTAAALTDGSDSGDGVAAVTGLGTTGGIKVLTDCTSLGLAVSK